MTNTEQKMIMRLIGGARGDLQFDANGDIRYGIGFDKDTGKDVYGPTGPKLVQVKLDVENDRFTMWLTAHGAQFILENLQGFSRHEARFLELRADLHHQSINP